VSINFAHFHPFSSLIPVFFNKLCRYGCAIPTTVGVRSVLDYVVQQPCLSATAAATATGGSGCGSGRPVDRVVWINLREEPITYVGWEKKMAMCALRPHLRLLSLPTGNWQRFDLLLLNDVRLTACHGITAARQRTYVTTAAVPPLPRVPLHHCHL
jgi:hypothetical protein